MLSSTTIDLAHSGVCETELLAHELKRRVNDCLRRAYISTM